jgi:hypothetical protein
MATNNNNSNNKKAHRSIAVLKLPEVISLLITYVQGILKAMTGNPTFPTPNPPLTAVSGAVNALQDAETAALMRATGTVATRNEKRATLVALLELLRGYVQSVAECDSRERNLDHRELGARAQEDDGARTARLRGEGDHALRLGEADCTARRSSCRLPLAVQHRRRQDLGRRVGDAAGEDDRHGPSGRDDGPVPLPLGHQGRSE